MFPRLLLIFTLAAFPLAPFASLPARATEDIPLTFPHDPAETWFSDTWRAPRSGGRRHQGTDLMAPKMTAVYAAADGVITTIKWSHRAGRYVGIAHEGGWETYYMHLNNDVVGNDGAAPWLMAVVWGLHEGAEVKAGQLIGWSGDSGNADGGVPHTHFELHRNGRAVNPYPHLVAALERLHRTTVLSLTPTGEAFGYIR